MRLGRQSIVSDVLIYDTLVNGPSAGVYFTWMLMVGATSYMVWRTIAPRWARAYPDGKVAKRYGISTSDSILFARYGYRKQITIDIRPSVAILITFFALFYLIRYYHDDYLTLHGKFDTVSGKLEEYKIGRIYTSRSYWEQDVLALDNGRRFEVSCTPRRPDATAGSPGACLNMHIGDHVKIDYQVLSVGRYRSDPLRIWWQRPS